MVNVSSDSIRCFLCFDCSNTLTIHVTTIAAIAHTVWFKTLSGKYNTFGVISNDFRLVLFIHVPQISFGKGCAHNQYQMVYFILKYDRMVEILVNVCHNGKRKLFSRRFGWRYFMTQKKKVSFFPDFRRLSDTKLRSFKTQLDVPKIIQMSRNRDSLKIIFKYLMKM